MVNSPLEGVVLAALQPWMLLCWTFSGKRIKWIVASQFQGFLNEMDNLNFFQFSFRFIFEVEMVLVTLVNYPQRGLGRRSAFLLVLLVLPMSFNTIDHGVYLGHLPDWG